MNKHLHRIIFNAARGMRMVVQETATSTGKGVSKGTSKGKSKGTARAAGTTTTAASVALFGVLVALPGQAQIVSGPMVPGPLRPTVLVASNGVPLVNIQTPSAAGVSRNVYQQFDVMRNGAILNNSRLNVQTQLGGFVQGNAWLARGPARVILNEINSGSPTQLQGYVEVGGQRAEVIVANPAGISVDGGGFINASRATLTTGTPQFNAMGGLDSFLVRGGTVSIDGAGLDAGKTDYAAILARAVQVNAGIWASELKVVAGANQVSADSGQVTPVAGTGAVPTYALDVAALGGMYAQKITLIGTEAGLGVRNAGNVGAGAGGLVVTAQGRLENTGTLEGQRVELSSRGDIDNRGGTIRQTSSAGLTIDSPVLSNTRGGVIGAEPGDGATGVAGAGNVPSSLATSTAAASTGGALPDVSYYAPPAAGAITAAGTIRNDGGRIYAGGPITLKTPQIDNAGGTLNVATMAVTGARFSNAGGTLNVSQGFGANVGLFDNTGGKLSAGSVNIATSGDLLNMDGTLTGAGDATLSVAGRIDNTRGTLTAMGRLSAQVTKTVDNTAGTIDAGTDLAMKAQTLNTSGAMRGGNDTTLAVGGALVNGGSITAGRHTAIDAGSVASGSAGLLGAGVQTDGRLGTEGDLRVTSTGALVANGSNLAAGSATLQGASVDLSGSQTGGASIAVAATQSDVRTSGKAKVVTPGTLRITAVGALDNTGGTITGNGNVYFMAATFDNSAKGVVAAVHSDLSVTTSGATTNNEGALQAGGKVALVNGGLINTGGKVSGASLTVNTGGNALDNSKRGTLAASTTLDVVSGVLNNDTGLIQSAGDMTLDTNGQKLTNTRAAGYSIAQGGITSADRLTLKNVGAVDNTAGFIGAKNALKADTQAFSNREGGVVLGQASVSIDAAGAGYDNRRGQTQAMGDLTLKAGAAGRIDNTGGLVRSLANTTLAAGALSNANTKAKDQGIEGNKVAISATTLDNTDGAIRADIDATVTGAGSLNNTHGLITARNVLRIAGANTLAIDNTEGTLAADKKVEVAGQAVSGKGTVRSGEDLSLSLAQNLVNDGELGAKGNFSYVTTGTLVNNGKLIAGKTLTVGGSDVTNSAGAEMSGADTVVKAGDTLANRGLIDSIGSRSAIGRTQIDASTLDNKLSGRIYGDAVSIATRSLNNEDGATIAARSTLDIGTRSLRNTEHSLLFSAGSMAIGGGLDEKRRATPLGGDTLDNLSADIESLGNMRIAMGAIDNIDTHFAVTRTTGPTVFDKYTVTPLGGIELPFDKFKLDRGSRTWSTVINGQTLTGKGWYERKYVSTTEVDQAASPPEPGRIVSGGDMTLSGKLRNRDSQIMAGGTSTLPPAQDVDNRATMGEKVVTLSGLQTYAPPVKGDNVGLGTVIAPQVSRTTFELGASCINDCPDAVISGRKPAASATVALGGVPVGTAGVVTPGTRARVILEVPSAVGGTVTVPGNSADPGTRVTYPVALVVRTSMPNTSIPRASLFGVRRDAGSRYLVETDPRFASYRNWLSSDYLLNNLGQDPANALKRLGDGFYEQRLIREQVAQLTGYRYLDGFGNDDDQYAALMNNGATLARQYGLRPGIALSAAQMAQLTSDIVWLVEQTVTLPDGSTEQALVPQVYVRVRPGDITGSGSLLSGDRMIIQGPPGSPDVGNLENGGTIAGRSLVSINAENIHNLGGRISGGSVVLHAANDIANIGGTIDAKDALLLTAGHDINVETTTQSQAGLLASRTNIDRVAGLYVSSPNATLIANARNDVNVTGGVLSNTGQGSFTSITAGRSINLGTVTESESRLSVFNSSTFRGDAASKDIGSTIVGTGTVLLDAQGGDINTRAAAIDAGPGVLGLTAVGDINIFAGQETRLMVDRSQAKQRRTFKSITTTIAADASSSTSIGSSLSGGSIGLFAEGDINVVGSDIAARKNATFRAGGSVNIVSSTDSASVSAERTRTTKGFIVPKLGGPSIDRALSLAQHAEVSTQTQHASNVTAGENLTVEAGHQANVYASTLLAGKDLKVSGREVNVISGTNEVSKEFGTETAKKSIGTMGNPKRSGKGMNGKSSVTDRLYQTTLAQSTLSGRNVTLTATEGNLTLGAARIRADEQVALNAPNGRVNMAVVRTTTEVSQSRGERDPMYQRTRDTGAHVEAANYTRIDSGSLRLDTPELNVQWGQNTGKGPSGAQAAQQTLEQVLAAQRNQPGMGWLNQVENDPALGNLRINWQGVPLAQRQWAEKQGSLTEAGGAVVAIVVAVLSWGAASGAGAAAGSAVGGGTTGTIVSAAVTAGVTSIASQGAVSLINNNGDIGRVVEDLTSSQGIKSIVTAMATAGALQGLNIGLGMENYTAANVGRTLADGSAVGWTQVLQRNLINGVSGGLINSAIQGTSVEEGIKSGLLNGLLNTAASGSAQWIGANGPDGNQNLNRLASEVAHAIAGCVVGAGRAAGSGGMGAGAGCGAGAIGAVVGHVTGQIYNPNADPQYAERTVRLGQMVAGIAGALVGRTQAAADIASAAGANAIENNWLSGAQKRLRATELATCSKGEAPLSCQFKTAERWIGVDADQQGVFDRLSAAKDLVAVNPTPANLIALNNAITGMVNLVGEFEASGDKGAVRTLSAALVPAVLLRGQSCAALQGPAGCGPIVLTPTERSVVGTAFSEFGVAADGALGASNLRNMQAIGEAIASGGASTWAAIADASRGLAATTRQLVRPANAVGAVGEEAVQGTGTTLPRATDGTADSAYSSAGMRYGNTTAADAAGNPLPTMPSLGAGGANGGVIRGFTPTESGIINEAQGILKSSELAKIQAAHAAGKPVTITVGSRLIQYEPGLPASGMTMFGENGFLIGREAFTSPAELKQTILHELHRLTTTNSSNGVSGALAAQETKAAADFAAKAVKEIK